MNKNLIKSRLLRDIRDQLGRELGIARFSAAGDCGHDEDGKFSEGNTCAAGGLENKEYDYSRISIEERKQLDDLILNSINEFYESWRSKRKDNPKEREPSLTATFIRDYLNQHGGIPRFYKISENKSRDRLVRSSLERMRKAGLIGSSLGFGESKRETRNYEPKDL